MQPDRFNRLTAELAAASPAQILKLEDFVSGSVKQQFVSVLLARRARTVSQRRCCPHCASDNVVLHGKDQNQRQRFKCRACRRTYNILTGTPMARARKPEKWAAYLDYMTEHHTIRAIRQSGIGLNQVTIWRWRHRFLRAAATDHAEMLRGVIEVDETVFRRSFKGSRGLGKSLKSEATPPGAQANNVIRRGNDGIRVLTALDSSDGIIQAMPLFVSEIEMALVGRIAAGSVLCAPDCVVYARIAAAADAEPHFILDARDSENGAGGIAAAGHGQGRLGLRRVHHHHRQLRRLVNERCRGVASRYLDHYLGWHRAMIRAGFAGRMLLVRALAVPTPNTV